METLEDYYERTKDMVGHRTSQYTRVALIACRDERDQAAEEALYE